jgi:hypothetical protein
LVHNLPTLEQHNSIVKNVVGGWQVGSVVSVASGSAVTIYGTVPGVGLPKDSPWGLGNAGDVAGNNLNANAELPMRVPGQPCKANDAQKASIAAKLGISPTAVWLNPNAFTWDGFPLGGYPNAGPGQCPGPGIADVDLAFDKNWRLPFHGNKYLGEGARLQFRLELFNAFNHPMFRFGNVQNPPGVNLNWDASGASIVGNKISCPNCQPSSAKFGTVQTPSQIGNREIQYALKLVF